MRIRPMENPSREAVMRKARSVGRELQDLTELFDIQEPEEMRLTQSEAYRVMEVEAEWQNLS